MPSVTLPPRGERDPKHTIELVESLMGRKPELRYAFIQDKARFAKDLDLCARGLPPMR